MKVTVSCCLCREKVDYEVDLKAGWNLRYDGVDVESGFCPKHSIIADWADSQCSGCVGGWGECTLWKSFAYNKHNLTENDFNVIESGICPKRTNGTFSFSRANGIENMDLSEKASTDSGKTFSNAIKNYWTLFPEK